MKKNYFLLVALWVATTGFNTANAALPSGITASDETGEHWYALKNGSNALSFPTVEGTEVSSVAYGGGTDAAFYVKFVSADTGYKIVTKTGLELKTQAGKTTVVAAGSGDTYDFDGNKIIAVASLKGLWEFNDPADLAHATVGNDLKYRSNETDRTTTPVDGSEFTSTAGVAEVADAGAVSIPDRRHFFVEHQIPANGGGSKVNEYTLLYDWKSPNIDRSGSGCHVTFLQTDPTNNNDGELFYKRGDNGVGLGENMVRYVGKDVVTANDTYYRYVVRIKSGERIQQYLNGEHYTDYNGDAPIALPTDSKHALALEGVLLMGDEDGENKAVTVSNIALWDRALSPEEIAAMPNVGEAVPQTTYLGETGAPSITGVAFTFSEQTGGGDGSGIDVVDANILKVYSQDGILYVDVATAQPVKVYTIAGALVFSRVINGKTSIALPKGVYIVKAATQTRKVIL